MIFPSATWIERQAVANRELVWSMRRDLDKGEAEAVMLAVLRRKQEGAMNFASSL